MRFLLVLSVLAPVGACKKKTPDAAEQQPVSRIDSALQVVMVSPSEIPVDTPTAVQVVGTAFQSGAEVKVGEQWVTGVRFDNANTLSLTTPALPDGAYDVTVQNPDADSATLWAGLIVGTGGRTTVTANREPCSPVTVYFELDQADLGDRGLNALKAQLDCWREGTNELVVAGHADERGTTDYNIALGERRADVVFRHLVRSGIPQGRLRAVSWGEEKPADPAHTERAWAANRRTEVSPQ